MNNLFDSLMNRETESEGEKLCTIVYAGPKKVVEKTENGTVTKHDNKVFSIEILIKGTSLVKPIDFDEEHISSLDYAINSMSRQNSLKGWKYSEILDYYKKHPLTVWAEEKTSKKGNKYFAYSFAKPTAKA